MAALWGLLALLSVVVTIHAEPAPQVLSQAPVHLRSGSIPEWDEFARQRPDSAGLILRFSAHTNSDEACLLISQDNVKLDWPVELNGKKIGTLFLMEAPLVHALALPPGTLREGGNVLSIIPPKENDDVLINQVALDLRPKRAVLGGAELFVRVEDGDSGAALPCRLTIVDRGGNLAALSDRSDGGLAVRPGVVYTSNGEAKVGIIPGSYTVYATRGFEYGLAHERVMINPGQPAHLRLALRREVATPGLICSDTHIHTGTFARHGDASIDERTITLAGEGIEMPISTEHDCLVDFAGPARRTGVENWFTPVIGEEVTTTRGHFNIFPVDAHAPLPDKTVTDWPRLISQFRSTPGVQVVVLNHPRNVHNQFQPFASTNFNGVTGENLRGFEFTFDAIEVANSSALQSDWMISFRDWFALLNYGCRVTAVGSSDGHDVSRYIVGQGRTYIVCKDTDPARINVDEACQNLKRGRALVSLGLLANLTVNEKFGVGDLATGLGDELHITVSVQGPSWVSADRVELFANGVRIRDQSVEQPTASPPGSRSASPLRLELSWRIPRPKHDCFLVALASGPGVREPFWAVARPYQPSSPKWDPRVLGATNPIWIDADGDGQFTPARQYARQLLREHDNNPAALESVLADFDSAVAAQVQSLAKARSQ
jgi:hypothetical protein